MANHSRAPNPINRDGPNTPADADGAILRLSHLAPFAEGASRRCFIHPDDPALCVKITKPEAQGKIRRKARGWRGFFRTARHYDQSLLEFAEYRRLAECGDSAGWRHIPRHFGFADTDLGRGAITELIRNHDGTIAPDMGEIIRKDGGCSAVTLEEFCAFLRKKLPVKWREPFAQNVVCARLAGGKERLFIVDGLGRREWMPIDDWSPHLRRRRAARIERRFRKLLERSLWRSHFQKENPWQTTAAHRIP